jgi:type IV pilus assembly protein PilO
MRDQLIVTAIGLVIVLGLVVGFLVVPQFGKLASLDQEIEQAQADVAVQQSLLTQREEMKDRAAETDAKTLKLGNLVPDRPDLPSLIIELQDIAFASGVKLTAITPSDPTTATAGTYMVIPIDMTVQGTWTDTVDYLQRIPRLARGVRTMEFAATVVEADDTNDLSPYSEQTLVKIEAYSLPSTPTAGAPAPAPAPTQ